jgi:hypothetical protein
MTPHRARFHGTSPGCSLGQCQLDLRIVAMERSMEVKTTCSIGTENDYLRHVSTISEKKHKLDFPDVEKSTWLELVPSQSMRRISKSHGPPIVTTEVTWVFYHSHEHLANSEDFLCCPPLHPKRQTNGLAMGD